MPLGYIHSIESMGLVDGPGVRSVVFMQGCKLRCLYCHNPDTWQITSDKAIVETPNSLFEKILRFKPYFGKNGGVTFSGGEPLLQAEFLKEVIPLFNEAEISVCIDTSGFYEGDVSFLQTSDLILFDIKHYLPRNYKEITGREIDASLRVLSQIQKMSIPLWIRHVVVPGLTDNEEDMIGLFEYLKGVKNIQKIELLPYHTLGVHKYKSLGIPYPLEGVNPITKENIKNWQALMDTLIDNK